MSALKTLLTGDDLLQMGSDADGYELIKGQLVPRGGSSTVAPA